MSLPRRHRLSGQAAFSSVFDQAIVSADAHFRVFGCATALQDCRLGMAVSRQVDKRAVARNRLKRIIRESFRTYLSSRAESACGPEHEPRSLDVVVVPRRPAVALDNRQLFERLASHWQRIDRRVGEANAGPIKQPT